MNMMILIMMMMLSINWNYLFISIYLKSIFIMTGTALLKIRSSSLLLLRINNGMELLPHFLLFCKPKFSPLTKFYSLVFELGMYIVLHHVSRIGGLTCLLTCWISSQNIPLQYPPHFSSTYVFLIHLHFRHLI